MALTVHPADGFINRLLQQSSRAAPATTEGKSGNMGGKDQVSISPQARDASTTSSPDTKLESKLLQMYNQNGLNSA